VTAAPKFQEKTKSRSTVTSQSLSQTNASSVTPTPSVVSRLRASPIMDDVQGDGWSEDDDLDVDGEEEQEEVSDHGVGELLRYSKASETNFKN
jgi:hypothetical protein